MSVTTETARQAADEWTRLRDLHPSSTTPKLFVDSGDALAVLVPQLLDQLAQKRSTIETLRESSRRGTADLSAQRDELRERCRQLEAALGAVDKTWEGWTMDSAFDREERTRLIARTLEGTSQPDEAP